MMEQLKDGIYLLRFRHDGVDYARKVLVEKDYYRFVDEFDKPLPGSLVSVAVTIKSGSQFVPMNAEVIHWNDATETTPDDWALVLLTCPEASERVWPGYLEAGTWYYVDASECGEDVAFWADFPVGPNDLNGVTADLLPRQPVLVNAVAMATKGIGFGEGLNHG